jgi:3-methyladenine DNA glycosylase AlkD
MTLLEALKKDLHNAANPEKSKVYQRFFKTGKGEYGEGDTFLGITVPVQRSIAKRHQDISLKDLQELIKVNIHEYRFTALEILVMKYKRLSKNKHLSEKQKEQGHKKIFDFYIKNTKYINNWDLVDTSVEYIVGEYLETKDKSLLFALAQSKNIWERRMAIIATFNYIKKNIFSETLKIAEMLVHDEYDLIQKAVGWMLREVGKRSLQAEETFLKKFHKTMPRTMLRYAIERFPLEARLHYMTR